MGFIILIAASVLGLLLIGAGFNLLGDYLKYSGEAEPRPSLLAVIASFVFGAVLLYPLLSDLVVALIELFESGPLP